MTAARSPRTPASAGLGAALGSLRGNRRFQALWWSNVFFFGGVWTQTLVLGWLAFELTGSEFLVAVYTSLRLAPLLLGPVAGALADRYDRVRLLQVTSTWAVVAVGAVAALATTDRLGYAGVLIGGLAIGLAQSPSQPARASLVMDLVGPKNLSNANALNALAMNMTQVIGPGLGGALIAALGPAAALWVSTGWYVVSLLCLHPLRGLTHTAAPSHEPVLRMLGSGLRIIGRNRLAVAVLLVTVFANTLLWPIFQSFMPVFADQRFHLDAGGLGVLLTCNGIGGLVGSLIIAGMGDFRRKGSLFVFGTITWAVLWVVFAQLTTPWSGYLLMALIGLASATFGVLQTTLLLLTTAPSVHGRALGLQELAIGIMPLTALALGWFASQFGIAATTTVSASLLVVTLVLLAWRVPQLLSIDGPVADPADPSSDARPAADRSGAAA